MNIIKESHWSDELQIPETVAVCPDCGTKLTISPDGWTEAGDGSGMVCDSFTPWCDTEPDISNQQAWRKFEEAHPSFDMPYVYWLPVTVEIEKWLEQNYRFVENQ